jgi:acetyl esterase/lipase
MAGINDCACLWDRIDKQQRRPKSAMLTKINFKRVASLLKGLSIVGFSLLLAACQSPEIKILENIPYREIAGNSNPRSYLLDLYIPQLDSPKPLPLLIFIHGGGWLISSKEICPGEAFAKEGFAIACINYRYSSEAIFPAQIQDVMEAVRWLKANAGKYGYDRDRIGAFGDSAGGHLSALLGTLANDLPTVQNDTAYPKIYPQVQAVVDWYGPTDFSQVPRAFEGAPTPEKRSQNQDRPWLAYTEVIYRLLGGTASDRPALAAQANPITYIDEYDPPFLVIHGERDKVVPIDQSDLLIQTLKKGRVTVEYARLRDLDHSYYQDPDKKVVNPTIQKLTVDFFKRHLQ